MQRLHQSVPADGSERDARCAASSRDDGARHRDRAERDRRKRFFGHRAAIAAASQACSTPVEAGRHFACNDMMGIGALRAAAERNISVPRDCSIIGFDDVELGASPIRRCRRSGQSVRALGDMAAQTLIDRIVGKLAGTARRRVVRRGSSSGNRRRWCAETRRLVKRAATQRREGVRT